MCQAIAILLGSDAEFVCAMEQVLDLYRRSYDENRPLVCLDQASEQLIGEVMEPIPAEPCSPSGSTTSELSLRRHLITYIHSLSCAVKNDRVDRVFSTYAKRFVG